MGHLWGRCLFGGSEDGRWQQWPEAASAVAKRKNNVILISEDLLFSDFFFSRLEIKCPRTEQHETVYRACENVGTGRQEFGAIICTSIKVRPETHLGGGHLQATINTS